MTGRMEHDVGLATLVAQRLALVAEMSALTAELQRLNQKLSGIQIEVLRLQLEIGRNGRSAELVRDLHDAEENAEAIRQACTPWAIAQASRLIVAGCPSRASSSGLTITPASTSTAGMGAVRSTASPS